MTTPTKHRFSFQSAVQPDSPNAKQSPEGGVSLTTCPQTPTRTTNLGSRRLPLPTPPRIANVGVRRAQQTSALLTSPARPGHFNRMRHIFELASNGYEALPNSYGSVTYPRLPNQSPESSSSALQLEACQRLDLLHISSYGQGSPSPAKGQGSTTAESHVDDCSLPGKGSNLSKSSSTSIMLSGSNALITKRHPRFSPSDCANDAQVNEGVSKMSTGTTFSPEDSFTCHNSNVAEEESSISLEGQDFPSSSFRRSVTPSDVNFYLDQAAEALNSCNEGVRLPSLSGLMTDRCQPPATPNAQHKQHLKNKDSDQLSPLSPNVCIERGTSHCRSTRRMCGAEPVPETPTKLSRSSQEQDVGILGTTPQGYEAPGSGVRRRRTRF